MEVPTIADVRASASGSDTGVIRSMLRLTLLRLHSNWCARGAGDREQRGGVPNVMAGLAPPLLPSEKLLNNGHQDGLSGMRVNSSAHGGVGSDARQAPTSSLPSSSSDVSVKSMTSPPPTGSEVSSLSKHL